jgi:CubicO group peptidase (beta-lactamase class C family)
MLLTKWTTGFGFAVALTACMAPAASPQSTPMSGNAERIRRIEENTAVIPQGENKPLAADSKAPVTPKILFQAGSISKPVAGTAALYMVEQEAW